MLRGDDIKAAACTVCSFLVDGDDLADDPLARGGRTRLFCEDVLDVL